MINSNDIFSEIGLIVKKNDPSHQISFKQQTKYSAFLQIELGQDEKHVLQIHDDDEPYELAKKFCHEHRLNRLAISLVEKKIIQAKNYEEQKMKKNRNKTRKHLYQKSGSRTPQRANKSRSITPNKSNNINKNSLYVRGVIKNRINQEQRQKMRVQYENKQKQELTFKPKINSVSEKIVEFLRTNNTPKLDKKKQVSNQKLYEQLQQCTFKPKINKVSQRIANNKTLLRQERQIQAQLYHNQKSVAKNNKKNIDDQHLFHPQINPKSADKVTIPFQKRMQVAIEKKHRLTNSELCQDQQCSFQPKIGRPPKNREKQNSKIWENLYKNSRKDKSHLCTSQYSSKNNDYSNSNHIYQNLVQNRIRQTFSGLDSNEDGIISPSQIGLQNIPQGTLIFLRPIFQQMDQIQASLDFRQFRKAVLALLADTDQTKKGMFLSEKWWADKSQQDQLFKPKINKKSKAMIGNRSIHNLYSDGLRDKQERQDRLERQRAYREQKQLEQCSFQPSLNHSSKIYIERVSRKKDGLRNDKSLSQIIHSFMKQSV